MKKKRKLNQKGKIVFTALIFIVSIVVYHLIGILGEFATESNICLVAVVLGWGWLFAGQIIVYSIIWNED